jgi:hypothetical protein
VAKGRPTPGTAASAQPGASGLDPHIDATGARVPTPDPKDQTGDPDEPNPAMRVLRERKRRRTRTIPER